MTSHKKPFVGEWNRMGSQVRFYVSAVAGIPDALINYRSELLRVIAQMGLGAGTLAVIGGTVVIVGFLAMTTGAIVAVQGYNQFASVGVEALTGFASAFFNARRNSAGNRHGRVGGHRRRRCHRSAGGDADQRGNRRARGDRYPQRQLPGEHPSAGGTGRGDPAVLRGAHDGVSGRSRSAPRPSTARGPVSTTTTSTRSSARPMCSGRRSKSSWSL